MHRVEVLGHAKNVAKAAGFKIREEWLGGSGGGGCVLRGQKWIFLDLALPPDEQLDQICDALRGDPALTLIEIPGALEPLLDVRRSA